MPELTAPDPWTLFMSRVTKYGCWGRMTGRALAFDPNPQLTWPLGTKGRAGPRGFLPTGYQAQSQDFILSVHTAQGLGCCGLIEKPTLVGPGFYKKAG